MIMRRILILIRLNIMDENFKYKIQEIQNRGNNDDMYTRIQKSRFFRGNRNTNIFTNSHKRISPH